MKRNNLAVVTSGLTVRKGVEWLLIDTSGSMAAVMPGSSTRRIDCVHEALSHMSEDIQIISFDSTVALHIGNKTRFNPGGGTNLAPALTEVLKHEPNYIMVISDGRVYPENEALRIAGEIAKTAIIDVLYIGGNDYEEKAFMQSLAEIGNGRFKRYDLSVEGSGLALTSAIQHLLPPPDGEVVL